MLKGQAEHGLQIVSAMALHGLTRKLPFAQAEHGLQTRSVMAVHSFKANWPSGQGEQSGTG